MREKVRFQVASLVKASRADRTLVRRLLHVEDLVNGQSPALAKSFPALAALERCLFAVDVAEKEETNSLISLVGENVRRGTRFQYFSRLIRRLLLKFVD